jgi:hypothetical protein
MALNAVAVTEANYHRYAELAEDYETTVLEKEDVINNVMIMDRTLTPVKFWWMTIDNFMDKYTIVANATETEFAVVEPK